MESVLLSLGQWAKPYSYQIALAVVASALVIYGNELNGIIKHMVRKQHFLVRTIVFVTVCFAGYGALTVLLTSFLSRQLVNVPALYFGPLVIGIFLVLGLVAERQKQI